MNLLHNFISNNQQLFTYFDPFSRKFKPVDSQKKYAKATIKGNSYYPNLYGIVSFEDVSGGTIVTSEIYGLPDYSEATENIPQIGPHGFHIHEYGNCENDFSKAGGHYNPDNQPHGNHAGDLPVIFSNNGYSKMSFFTNKFKVLDIVGKSIIIHQSPDDYKSQPSGNSGKRIACGIIYETHTYCQ